jgi:uncharacterized protein (TIGR00255 family)
MPIRSMTGFAQVRGEVAHRGSATATANTSSYGRLAFSLSLKSVNHRFLDLHFRLPSASDSLEMQLRHLLKDKMARGHVEVTLSLERSVSDTISLNRDIVGGYIAAFRAAASEFSLPGEPDLNVVLRIPGALDSANEACDGEFEAAVMSKVGEALDRLNQMREEEGRGIARELRQRMANLVDAGKSVQQHRRSVLRHYSERL